MTGRRWTNLGLWACYGLTWAILSAGIRFHAVYVRTKGASVNRAGTAWRTSADVLEAEFLMNLFLRIGFGSLLASVGLTVTVLCVRLRAGSQCARGFEIRNVPPT
jgi:hypothetical protein